MDFLGLWPARTDFMSFSPVELGDRPYGQIDEHRRNIIADAAARASSTWQAAAVAAGALADGFCSRHDVWSAH